jgi:hypothetical protein
MKKKMIKWALCIWCGATVMMTNNVMANCVDETGINDEIVEATIQIDMQQEINMIDIQYSTASYIGGVVVGNGIALRTGPGASNTILERMYNKEKVKVNLTKSNRECPSGRWYYLQRTKTGTWGWASTEYINIYD